VQAKKNPLSIAQRVRKGLVPIYWGASSLHANAA